MAIDPKDIEEDLDDQPSIAADDPTAMWSEEALRELGLGDVADRHSKPPGAKSLPPPLPPPKPAAKPTPKPPIAQRPHVPARAIERRKKPSAVMSWAVTFVLAGGLGTVVYFFVRFLKG